MSDREHEPSVPPASDLSIDSEERPAPWTHERPAVTGMERAAEPSMMMARLTETLNLFPEVEWDRLAVAGGEGAVYGWVERPRTAQVRELARAVQEAVGQSLKALGDVADATGLEVRTEFAQTLGSLADLASAIEGLEHRADFLVLLVYEGRVDGLSTSSAELSEEFGRRLGYAEGGHVPCVRVEDALPGVTRASRL